MHNVFGSLTSSARKRRTEVAYIWQQAGWPNFTWDGDAVDQHVYAYALEASRMVGEIKHLSEAEKTDL